MDVRRPLTRKKPTGILFIIALVAGLTIAILHSNWFKTINNQETTPAQAATLPAIRIGLQAGHWKNDELPDELSKLRYESTGTSAAGFDEWQVNLDIAQRTAGLLRAKGFAVDILPATVPEAYKADAFIAIHADGNDDDTVSGYKVAPSSFDVTGKAQALSDQITRIYGRVTGMPQNPAVSDDMQQYYAFNYQVYYHAISAQTPAVLVETGFLTNIADRKVITSNPQLAAEGIAQGIEQFFATSK